MLVCRNQVVDCHEQFSADLLEDTCKIPRDFGANYFRGVIVVRVQHLQRVFFLKDLHDPHEHSLSVLHATHIFNPFSPRKDIDWGSLDIIN